MTLYNNDQKFDEFSFAREHFEELVTKLGSEECKSMQHGDVEFLLERDGREILRLLFQSYLDVRAGEEKKRAYRA